jgi:gamma-glutamyltranspeptidase/glutathione hydrolase
MMLKNKPRTMAGSPICSIISKHHVAPRQSRLLALAAALLVLLIGCSDRGKEQAGVVGTVRGFLGGAVADEPRAALVARDILSAGGSAADAAVALYFTLGATLPSTASLGGGGVCLVYDVKLNRTEMLDFASRTPAGGGPIALPTGPRGMFLLHSRHGKLRWEQLVGNAEAVARFGRPVSRALAADLLAAQAILQRDPELRRTFLKSDGTTYREGEILVQHDLSTLLSAIRARGSGELYNGPVAQRFVESAIAQGAAITIEDMRAAVVAWRPAVAVRHDDIALLVTSPPAVGGLVEGQIWGAAAPRWRRASPEERPHLLAQAGLRAWLDRSRWLAPDLTTAVSPPELVNDRHLATLMASYRADQRTPPPRVRSEPMPDDAAASGFVTADRDGNAVACTVSSYGLFGAGRMAAGTGVVLARAPDGVAAGPQWLGPVIGTTTSDRRLTLRSDATGRQQVLFAAAASGGAPAASALAGVALRTLIERRTLEEAMDARRLHFEGAPADTVFVEEGVQPRLPGLSERGYQVVPVPVIGRVNAFWCPDGLTDEPARCEFRPDRRGFGLAAGGS